MAKTLCASLTMVPLVPLTTVPSADTGPALGAGVGVTDAPGSSDPLVTAWPKGAETGSGVTAVGFWPENCQARTYSTCLSPVPAVLSRSMNMAAPSVVSYFGWTIVTLPSKYQVIDDEFGSHSAP